MLSKPIIEVLATHLSRGGNSLCFYHSKPNWPIIVSFSFKISLRRGSLDFVVSHQHNLVKLMEDIVFSILDTPILNVKGLVPIWTFKIHEAVI